jgi:hypothetical protein
MLVLTWQEKKIFLLCHQKNDGVLIAGEIIKKICNHLKPKFLGKFISFDLSKTYIMFGLTQLGIFHTVISLIAVATGAIALIRNGKISWDNSLGKTYVITTIIVCLTGFGIFQHGGFGKPHALGVITLMVLVIIFAAKIGIFKSYSPYVVTVGYSLTFLFHIIPGITETASRLPLDAPLASGPEDPNIQKAIGICFVLFLIGATLQVRKMKKSS